MFYCALCLYYNIISFHENVEFVMLTICFLLCPSSLDMATTSYASIVTPWYPRISNHSADLCLWYAQYYHRRLLLTRYIRIESILFWLLHHYWNPFMTRIMSKIFPTGRWVAGPFSRNHFTTTYNTSHANFLLIPRVEGNIATSSNQAGTEKHGRPTSAKYLSVPLALLSVMYYSAM